MSVKDYVEVWRTRDLIDYVLMDLEKKVKRDLPTKLSVFLTALSCYTREPINLFLKGESGVGKSYNVIETLKYFPEEDVICLGGITPKAPIYEYGQLCNKFGEPIDLNDKPIKPKRKDYVSEMEYEEALRKYREDLKRFNEEIREGYTSVNLKNKILVFLEAPEPETFRVLYPILSHDKEEIEHHSVDKSGKGSLRTRKIKIKGWPATIFLSTDKKYMEELATRSFTVSPEASKEKIENANILTNQKASFPWEYKIETEETKIIKMLIRNLKNKLINEKIDVVIPFPNIHELFPKEIVRDMRDFQHFIQLLKTITVLHYYQRPFMEFGEKYIVSNVKDVEKALEIYSKLFETTRTGTEEKILRFYHEIVKEREEWTLQELVKTYNERNVKKASSKTIWHWMNRLSEIGYVNIRKSEEDKRLNIYEPLMKNEEKFEKILISGERKSITSILEKGFEEWLEKILLIGGSGNKIKFSMYKTIDEKGSWGEVEITIEEFIQKIIGSDTLIRRIFSEEEESRKIEKEEKEIRKEENRRISNNLTLEKCSLCQCFQEKYNLCLISGLKTGPNDVCDKFIMRSEKHDQHVEDPQKIQGETKVERNDQIEDRNHDRGEVSEAEVQGDTQVLVDEDLRKAVEYLNMYRSVGRLRFEMDLKDCGVEDPKVVLEKLVKLEYVKATSEVVNATSKLPKIKLPLSKFIGGG